MLCDLNLSKSWILKNLKKNYKTSYLAGEYERVSLEIEELNLISDPDMLSMVEEEKNILQQSKNNLVV